MSANEISDSLRETSVREISVFTHADVNRFETGAALR
jgi:hypothetical protein